MSNEEDEEAQETREEAPKVEEVKKVIPPAKKGTKNVRGDYVVTTIDIPDMRTGLKEGRNKNALIESDSDSDEGYGEEEEAVVEDKKEEVKVEGKLH